MGSNAMINLDAFKTAKPAATLAHLNPAEDSLSDGLTASYGVLHYKGKVWSLRYKGEHHYFNRPDDGTPSSFIDVVILRQAKNKSRSFYQGWDPNASEGSRPICSSLNGLRPDGDAAQPQAPVCALCPRNELKMNDKGKRTKECQERKRLAVLVMPDQTKPFFQGQPLAEPVFLPIPAGSFNDLGSMADVMEKQGWHYAQYITRITFDPKESYPKMQFRPIRGLTDQEGAAVAELVKDPLAKRITAEDQSEAPAFAQVPPPASLAQVTQQAAPAPTISQQAVAKITRPAPAAEAPPPAFLDLKPNPQPAQAAPPPQAAQQTVADTGPALMSTPEMDDRIAGLMKLVK